MGNTAEEEYDHNDVMMTMTRRVVDKRTWKMICRYYPDGRAFKTDTEECLECTKGDREERDRLEGEKKVREMERLSSPLLNALFNRRIGE